MTSLTIHDCCCSDAPEITVPNRRIGQKLGGEVVLECVIDAVPTASHYWTRDSLPVALSSKYVTDEFDELDGRVTLRLNIRNLQSTDYDDYQCVAANELGRTQKTVTLYGSLASLTNSYIIKHNTVACLFFTNYIWA